MAAVCALDELIKDYLVCRNLTSTLKSFETELKNDKDKGFQVDKVIDFLLQHIVNYELASLRDYWSHLERRLFSCLEQVHQNAARKLEICLLKFYLVNAISNGRQDKVTEFFDKYALELYNQAEWKDWTILPFVKNPDENSAFSMYFTKQWQDAFWLSLHNFLNVIFQCMPKPALLKYEEEQFKMKQLQEETEALREKLSALQLQLGEPLDVPSKSNSFSRNVRSEVPVELMDDFYIIAQEAPQSESQPKSLKSLIKTIGLPASPILSRKQTPTTSRKVSSQYPVSVATEDKSTLRADQNKTKSRSLIGGSPRMKSQDNLFSKNVSVIKVPEDVKMTKIETPASVRAEIQAVLKSGIESTKKKCSPVDGSQTSPFILLSQETYSEHCAPVTHVKFSSSGSFVASADSEGVIKIWTPSLKTITTVMSKNILSLEWASKSERILLHGNRSGSIRLYDINDKKTIYELLPEPHHTTRILTISCSPIGTSFVCSAAGKTKTSSSQDRETHPSGKLYLYNMKTMRPERQLLLEANPAPINCVSHNHNGQLLITGGADGMVRLFDLKCYDCIASWQAHSGEVYSVQFSPDETSCYTMGCDGKFIQWNAMKTGYKIMEVNLHEGAIGPFFIPGASGVKQSQKPLGKLFAFDSEGKYVLTCGPAEGVIYQLSRNSSPNLVMNLKGHRSSVMSVDWSSITDCGVCLTGSVDCSVRVSTLLAQ